MIPSENNGQQSKTMTDFIINDIAQKSSKKECSDTGIELWKKNCPKCNRQQVYTRKDVLVKATRENAVCKYCRSKNKVVSLETRRKLSESRKGKSSWSRGKHLSEEHRRKIAEAGTGKIGNNFGKKHTTETRQKMSKVAIGRVMSEDQKRKLRIIRCQRLKTLGIAGCQDKGASQWFARLNNNGFAYQENWYCKELGYYADGYDKNLHIWYEFDTSYHRYPYIKDRDLIRQNNIISHFRSTGNPLRHFIRAFADKNGKVLCEVYINK